MALELSGISCFFGAVKAVDGASLRVEGGEILCLVGPSGCGKTTLLRVAGGFERHEGAVVLFGETLAGRGVFTPPEKRAIGFVFQDYVLFPHLSAIDNVAFGLAHLPKTERFSKARAELAAVGLKGLEDRYPHELSGGQQQRMALARALARRPRAMLLDEPFASVDPALRRRLREDLRALLKGAGAATILVTHDAEEALALGDRLALMKEGRIVETGAPSDLYFRPRTIEAAAAFPGAQVLKGRVADGALEWALGRTPVDAPDGDAAVAALSGAIRAAPAADGPFAVTDCRFDPPAFRAALRAPSGATFFAAADEALSPGTRADIAVRPDLLRIFGA